MQRRGGTRLRKGVASLTLEKLILEKTAAGFKGRVGGAPAAS
ncbi:MAG: hypothetical protein ACJ8H8_23045 [Geminicoccaceae bacterium]